MANRKKSNPYIQWGKVATVHDQDPESNGEDIIEIKKIEENRNVLFQFNIIDRGYTFSIELDTLKEVINGF